MASLVNCFYTNCTTLSNGCTVYSASTGGTLANYYFSDGTNCYATNSSGVISATTACSPITYDYYLASIYPCSTCNPSANGYLVAFPAGTSVTLNRYYAPYFYDGNVYYVTASTVTTGGVILMAGGQTTCALACGV